MNAPALPAPHCSELLKKIDIVGERPERIFVDFSYERLATLGVSARDIFDALVRENAVGKRIGWHSFRHSLATNLRSLGVDIKVAQELMRHASCRTTLDVYTRAVDQQKREASRRVLELMLPQEIRKLQHPSAPSEGEMSIRRCRQIHRKKGDIGGPDRDRTDDLFHAMESKEKISC